VTVLAIIGGLLLVALIVLAIFFYKRKQQMDELRRELERSQAGNSVVIESKVPLIKTTI
jgi:Na+/melibiose symporter-like transporter